MIKKIAVAIAIILIMAVSVMVYSFFKTPEAASGPIEAIPITIDPDKTAEAEAGGAAVAPPDSAGQAADTPVETEAQAEAAEAEPALEPGMQVETEVAGEADTAAPAAGKTEAQAASQTGQETAVSPIIFEIMPTESQARFVIDEILRGAPNTVVGSTDQVAGQFALDPNDLSSVQVGIIQIDARTLATDNNLRNRAIKNFILLTNDFEFITFTPTQVTGLPESGAVGETYTFQVVGDLTITDVSRQVTFDVTATPTSETRIEGTATTSIRYPDFNLFIPDVPSVNAVDDVVHLELEFVAEAMQ